MKGLQGFEPPLNLVPTWRVQGRQLVLTNPHQSTCKLAPGQVGSALKSLWPSRFDVHLTIHWVDAARQRRATRPRSGSDSTPMEMPLTLHEMVSSPREWSPRRCGWSVASRGPIPRPSPGPMPCPRAGSNCPWPVTAPRRLSLALEPRTRAPSGPNRSHIRAKAPTFRPITGVRSLPSSRRAPRGIVTGPHKRRPSSCCSNFRTLPSAARDRMRS